MKKMMHYSVEVTKDIHWIGINDRRKELFENLWPLPYGVSYNSYLIVDQKTALVDTIELGTDGKYIERISSLLQGKELDYLIINHMEPDHSGEIEDVVRAFPEVTLVGNAKTFDIFENYYPDICENLLVVKDGDTLDLGKHKLRFVLTPMVHWPETMMTYEETEQVLFSGDAFGTFGTVDGVVMDKNLNFELYESEMRRYYSNIVGKYGMMVQRALAKFGDTPIKTICSLHGPIWQEHAERVISLYDKWSKGEGDDAVVVIYATMYNNTAFMADYIANVIAKEGVTDIRVYDVSKTHPSYLINEIWRCRGVVMGSCSYNTQIFPAMERLCSDMLGYGLGDRALSVFGSGSWSGGGVRNLLKFAEQAKWDIVGEPVEMMGRLCSDKYAECEALGKAMAKEILNK